MPEEVDIEYQERLAEVQAAIRRGIQGLATDRSEWAGIPLPVKDMRMVIHPSYPFAEPEPD